MKDTQRYIGRYLTARPIFLGVLRGKEAALYQQFLPLKGPVLDVGCGDGFFAETTFSKGAIDVGLDTPDSRIDEAKASWAYKKVVTYDGRIFPFPDRTFQTIVINSVLEHVADLPQLLTEVHRVLKPGGQCFATVMAAPWEDYLFGAKLFGNSYERWMKKKQVHVNLFTEKAWRASFAAAKFRPVSALSYVSSRAGMWLDILHYISVPQLISYMLTKKWVLWPRLTILYPTKWFARLMDEPVSQSRGGALFFVLKRI